ncbi:MAG: DUF58 domain-containing protein [bacterium]|nr:MAG: DUF58 domain-containing protein [bacterium]
MKTNYLDEHLIAKLSQIPIKPLSLAEGLFKGRHRSKKSGEEVEFKEFRPYIQGDDLKKIDWKRSARQETYFVKEMEDELNYKVHLIIDQSASMDQGGKDEMSKIEYSKYLVAALAYLFVKQGDQVQVSSFSNRFHSIFKSSNNIQKMPLLVESLNHLSTQGVSDFYSLIGKARPLRSDKMILFLLSDLICDPNTLHSCLAKLSSPKVKIILFHLISPDELNFPFKGDVHFLDPESNNTFSCNAGQIKNKFKAHWERFCNDLQFWTQKWDMEYRSFNTQTHYSENLLDFIKSYHLKP